MEDAPVPCKFQSALPIAHFTNDRTFVAISVCWRGIFSIWGFLKIRGTFFGVPIIRTIVYWGLYWGTLILRNYHMLKYTSMGVYHNGSLPCSTF